MPTLTTLVDNTIPVAADFNGNYTALNQAIGVNTAITSWTAGDLPYASAANTLSKLTITNNRVLVGTSGLPIWSTALTLSESGAAATLGTSGAGALTIVVEGNEGIVINRTASAITYVDLTPGATGNAPILQAQGETNVGLVLKTKGTGQLNLAVDGLGDAIIQTNGTTRATFNASGLTMGTNMPIVAAAVSGTPAAHALYRENVVKGWLNTSGSGTPAVDDSFNVTGIADTGAGAMTVTWDRDFASADYAVSVTPHSTPLGTDASALMGMSHSYAAGSVIVAAVRASDGAGTDPDTGYSVIAIGDSA